MKIQLIFLSISTISFIAYVVFLTIRVGILPSISESYYRLPERIHFLFPTFLCCVGFPIIATAQGGWLFLAGFAIVGVGTAPLFKESFIGRIHYICAFTGISAGFISLMFDCHYFLYVGICFIPIYLLEQFNVKNKMWWIEIFSFVAILGGLLFHYLSA